jgi:hypothetical protein
VLGAVRLSREADQVWWVAIFPDRSVPVLHSQVTLRLPEGAQLRSQDVTLPPAAGKLDVDGNVVRVTRDESLPAGQSLDVRVDFASALVDAPAPAWQSAPTPRPLPTLAPVRPARSSGSSAWSPGCLWVLLFLGFAAYSVIRGLVTGDWSHLSSSRRRTSSWSSSSSSWSSSDSSSSWSSSSSSWSSSDSSSSWSSSDSGGSGGGGDAG